MDRIVLARRSLDMSTRCRVRPRRPRGQVLSSSRCRRRSRGCPRRYHPARAPSAAPGAGVRRWFRGRSGVTTVRRRSCAPGCVRNASSPWSAPSPS